MIVLYGMKQLKIEKESFKYYCKCKNGATYVCDKCDEFVCEFCYNKKKQSENQIKKIKISIIQA